MPTYEYKCPSCSCSFELLRKFSDSDEVSCPECGSEAERIFTAVPVIFKGSGFYVTDHRGSQSQPKSTIKSDSDSKSPDSSGGGDKVSTSTADDD